jgi:hypothetical protein
MKRMVVADANSGQFPSLCGAWNKKGAARLDAFDNFVAANCVGKAAEAKMRQALTRMLYVSAAGKLVGLGTYFSLSLCFHYPRNALVLYRASCQESIRERSSALDGEYFTESKIKELIQKDV